MRNQTKETVAFLRMQLQKAILHLDAFESEADERKKIDHAVAYAEIMVDISKPHVHRAMVAIAAENMDDQNNAKVLGDFVVGEGGRITSVTKI